MATFENTFGGFLAAHLVAALGSPYLARDLRAVSRTMRAAIPPSPRRTIIALAKHGASRGSLVECEIAREKFAQKLASLDDWRDFYRAIMHRAAKNGYTDICDVVLEWCTSEECAFCVGEAMLHGAACCGDARMFRVAHDLQRRATPEHGTSLCYGIRGAAKHDHMNILKLAQELGVDMIVVGHLGVIYHNIEFMQYARNSGHFDYDFAILQAAEDAREDIIAQLYEWNDAARETCCALLMSGAARGGHKHLCERAREQARSRGIAIDLDACMFREAAHKGHAHICRLAHEWGARNFEMMLMFGMYGERRAICELAREWIIESGATSDEIVRIMNVMLRNSAHHNNMEFASLARDWGACDFHDALREAADGGYIDYCNLMRLWIEERGDHVDVNAILTRGARRMSMETLNLARRWSISLGVGLDIARMLDAAETPEDRETLAELARSWEH